ncbi:NIPSNAP domain-containing protein [Duganella sp. FT135W]|uniref:NIPSNAP domain-containing protein n=1 Tax=Duganella flavida TaxID=2692175 RepID=A0A6L8KFT8_9BURK|nr:NIPSNAP family protein [Duganella flavida]MYM26266.1 NIPSNAP domain-containing protein [Duganella flavida]
MRIFELRVYTLRSPQALAFYREVICPRHLNSFPLFEIEAHGFWTAISDKKPRLHMLVSYPAWADVEEVGSRYMHSPEFAEDVRDFDATEILGVESTILAPSASSPLR